MKWALSLAALAGLSLSSQALAEAPAGAQDFGALVPYDLDGSRTVDALRTLRAESDKLPSGQRKQELTFMRTLALSDLWVIARATHREALEKQVAENLGVEPSAAPRTLDAALAQLDSPVVHDIVSDAREAVRMTQGELPLSSSARGPRSESLYLSRVLDAIGNNSDPRANIPRLEGLASDPCEQPKAATCTPLYQDFDRAGRKAIHALARASEAVSVFQRESQDPFVVAMGPTHTTQTRALSSITLQPNTRLPQAMTRLQAVEGGSADAPDLLLLIGHDSVEYAFMPRVRIDDAFHVVLEKGDEPSFPNMGSVKFESSFAPFVRPIDSVVQTLKTLNARFPSARVAVGAVPETKSHIIARTLLSAKSAGFDKLSLLAATPAGEMRNVEVEVVAALQAGDVGPRDLSVVVRLGGFTVKRAGPSVTIPRVKSDSGFAFDFEALRSSAQPRKAKTSKLTFMSDVPAQTLAEAAFMIAPQDRTLTVVLP